MEGRTLLGALGLVGLAVIGAGTALLFAGGPSPAPPRPSFGPSSAPDSEAMKFSTTLYRGGIERDARAFGVAAPSPAELAAVFPYFDELKSPRSLRPGGAFTTARLRISLSTRRERGAVEGQSFGADHLVLRIENLTDRPLAYRVSTRVPDPRRCEAKGTIPHNAIALGPHEVALRTECLLQDAARLLLERVEVLRIPALSYVYVSRLEPGLALYDPRTAAGHTIPAGTVCPQAVAWRDIRDGAERGALAWRDIIDFYARHNCDQYAFFPGYRYRVDVASPLPARSPGGGP